jgi:hypothetical protein
MSFCGPKVSLKDKMFGSSGILSFSAVSAFTCIFGDDEWLR